MAGCRIGRPEAHRAQPLGEAESLGIRTRRLVPATLGRRTSLPAGSSPKLRLRVGNDPNQPWNLEIRMNGTQIVRREFSRKPIPSPGSSWNSTSAPPPAPPAG